MKIAAIVLLSCGVLTAEAQLQVQAAPPSQPAITQRLAPVGPDGKVQPLDGFVELRALKVSTAINDADREQIKSVVRDWVLDVQQQVIDNIDFMNEIEPFDGKPGFFDSFDPQDAQAIQRSMAYARQLNSAGSLLNILMFRRRLDSDAERAIRQTVYEYDMVVLRQSSNDGRDVAASTRHHYSASYRDAVGMFHSLLDRAATCIDEAVGAAKLSPETAAAVAPAVAKVKAAKDRTEVRAAVKGVLKDLTLAQRRALLLKVRDLAPITDPFAMF